MVGATEWQAQALWESRCKNGGLPGGIREGIPDAVASEPGLEG